MDNQIPVNDSDELQQNKEKKNALEINHNNEKNM